MGLRWMPLSDPVSPSFFEADRILNESPLLVHASCLVVPVIHCSLTRLAPWRRIQSRHASINRDPIPRPLACALTYTSSRRPQNSVPLSFVGSGRRTKAMAYPTSWPSLFAIKINCWGSEAPNRRRARSARACKTAAKLSDCEWWRRLIEATEFLRQEYKRLLVSPRHRMNDHIHP